MLLTGGYRRYSVVQDFLHPWSVGRLRGYGLALMELHGLSQGVDDGESHGQEMEHEIKTWARQRFYRDLRTFKYVAITTHIVGT